VEAQAALSSQGHYGGPKEGKGSDGSTSTGSVYAFDADSINGTTSTFLWKTSTTRSGETNSDNLRLRQGLHPEIGITADASFDRSRNAFMLWLFENSGGTYSAHSTRSI